MEQLSAPSLPGGLVSTSIVASCNGLTTIQLYKMYQTIKDFSVEQMKDIILDDNILKILYVTKYVLNFIFKVIVSLAFGIKTTIYKFLDFVDTIISFFIALYMLGVDTIHEKIVNNVIKSIPNSDLQKLLGILFKFMYTNIECEIN